MSNANHETSIVRRFPNVAALAGDGAARIDRQGSVVFEAVGLELEGAGVLGDDAYLVVGVAVLLVRGDLNADLQVYVLGCGEVLDDLLPQPVELAAIAFGVTSSSRLPIASRPSLSRVLPSSGGVGSLRTRLSGPAVPRL